MALIATIANVIVGLLFFAFLPGFIIVKLFFKDEELFERILLAIIFSIMIAMTIGIFFGYDRAQAAATGGFTTRNMWIGEIGITSLLAIGFLIKYTLEKREKPEEKPFKKKVKKKKS